MNLTDASILDTLRAELAAHNAREAETARVCDEGCLDRGVGSEVMSAQQRSTITRRIEIAEAGGRVGFVGLCRLDGTPARGKWYPSKWSSLEAWGTPKANGERGLDFIDGETLYASRCGDSHAVEKLAAKGFRWETRRLRADARYSYGGKRGLAGVFYGTLLTVAVDENGEETMPIRLAPPTLPGD